MCILDIRKGVSTFIAVLLLVAITASAGAFLYAVNMGYLKNAGSDSILLEALSLDSTSFDSEGLTAYVRNVGKGEVKIDKAYVDSIPVEGPGYSFEVNGPGVDDDQICAGEVGKVKIEIPDGFKAGKTYNFILISERNIRLSFSKRASISSIESDAETHPINWLEGWRQRKLHVINTSYGAGVNYQIKTIVYYGSGLDNGNTVYLNRGVKGDFGDIRFTSSDGISELDFWIETLYIGNYAIFWIEISGNLTEMDQTIYVYYNNSAATTTSNGEDTFVFFDDFSGDMSKWTKYKNGDKIYIESGNLVCGGGSTSSPYGHTVIGSTASYNEFKDGIIEADVYPSSVALPEIGFRGNFSLNTGYKGRWDCRSGNEPPWHRPSYYTWSAFGTSVPRFGIPSQWQKVKLVIYGSNFNIYSDDDLKSSVTDSQYTVPGEISLQNHYGSFSRFDNIRVRKYVEPEPIHGMWGEVEIYNPQ